MMQDEQLLAAFQVQGKLLLVQEVSQQLAQRLRGAAVRPGLAEQLALALRRLARPECQLTLPQQVEVATFFMPLTRLAAPSAAVAIPPQLLARANPLEPPQGYEIRGEVNPGDAHLLLLEILRDGILVASSTNPLLIFLEPPVTGQPVTFLVRATYSDYTTQTKTLVLQPTLFWFAGTGVNQPAAVVIENWPGLAAAAEVLITFIAQGRTQRMYCWVPAGQTVTGIFNPEFGQTNLLPSFSSSPLTLPTKGAGTLWTSKQRILSSGYQLRFTASTP